MSDDPELTDTVERIKGMVELDQRLRRRFDTLGLIAAVWIIEALEPDQDASLTLIWIVTGLACVGFAMLSLIWGHALFFLVDGLLFGAVSGFFVHSTLEGTNYLSRWPLVAWAFAGVLVLLALRRLRDYWQLRQTPGDPKGIGAALAWGVAGAVVLWLDFSGGNSYARHIDRGIALGDRKDYAKAIDEFNQAIRIDPRDPAGYWNRGVTRLKSGDHRAATTDFSMVIELEPMQARGYVNRGVCRHRVRDLEGAAADATRAIKLAPDSIDGYRLRAQVRLDQGKAAEARSDLEQCWKLRPELKEQFEKMVQAGEANKTEE